MSDKQSTILELWPKIKDDLEKFIADRPGWFIDSLQKGRPEKYHNDMIFLKDLGLTLNDSYHAQRVAEYQD